MKDIVYSLNEIKFVADTICSILKQHHIRVVSIKGKMGAGKTTLVGWIIQCLGFEVEISSPTYTIMNTYRFHGNMISHVDCYRIQSDKEYENLGLDDVLKQSNYVFFEWGIENLIEKPFLKLVLSKHDSPTLRTLQIEVVKDKGTSLN